MTQAATAQDRSKELALGAVSVVDVMPDAESHNLAAETFGPIDTTSDAVKNYSSPEQQRPTQPSVSELLDRAENHVAILAKFVVDNESNKRSVLTSNQMDSVLGPLRNALGDIRSGMAEVKTALGSAQDSAPSEQQLQEISQKLANLRSSIDTFATEGEGQRGVTYPASALSSIRNTLSQLETHPTLVLAPEKTQIPAYPFGTVAVVADFGNFQPGIETAVAQTLTAEEYEKAYQTKLAHELLAKQQELKLKQDEAFSQLISESGTNPIDIAARQESLGNKSVRDYLTERHTELLETITSASKDLKDGEEKLTADEATVVAIDAEVKLIHEHHNILAQQIDEDKAGIQHLEQIQERAQAAGEPSTSSVSSNKSNPLLATARDSAAKLINRFLKTSPSEISAEEPVSAPAAASSEQSENLRNAVAGKEKRLDELADKFYATKESLEKKHTALIELQNSIASLQAKLLGAKEEFRKALLNSCKNLSFKAPKEITDPVTEALLDISVPKTQNPIPSLSSITEILKDLGATTDQRGNTLFTDPNTGQTLTIAPRSAHGLDATLTVTDKDGKQLASDVIWNHHLAEVVEHFKKTGEAPVQSREIEEWTVSDKAMATLEADAAIDSTETAGMSLSQRAEQVVAYLSDKLGQVGFTATHENNKVDVENQEQVVTAILNPNAHTWSLYGALEATHLSTVDAFTRIKDLFTQMSKESSAPVSEGAPEETTSPDIDEDLAPSSVTPAAQAEEPPAAETPEPAQNDTKQTEEPSNETEKDKLTEQVLQAWNEAPDSEPFSFELSDGANIEVQSNKGTPVTTLRRRGKPDRLRKSGNVELSLRIMVGEYLKDR